MDAVGYGGQAAFAVITKTAKYTVGCLMVKGMGMGMGGEDVVTETNTILLRWRGPGRLHVRPRSGICL